MSESHFAERGNDYVPQSLGQLNSTFEVKAVDRQQAKSDEAHEQDNWKVLDMAVVEFRSQLDHGNLPSET